MIKEKYYRDPEMGIAYKLKEGNNLDKEFEIENFVYLDNASTTYPKPSEVYDFMYTFFKTCGVSPGRSECDASKEAGKLLSKTRQSLTNFLGGSDASRLVFTYNATDSLNMIINGIVKEGSHVITTNLEHNSVIRPLHHLAREKSIEVDYVPFDKNGFVHPDEFERKIKKTTVLVIMNHGSNVIGTVQPVKEIGKICRENSVAFAIDASQTAGVVPIDVKEMNIDIVAFTGHKSLLGPMGIGGLYLREGIDIEPSRFGGTGVSSEERFQPREYPHRLECGTTNMLGVAGLYMGQKYITQQGLENIHQKEMSLLKLLCEGLKEIKGVKLYCADSLKDHIAVLSFDINGYNPVDVGNRLNIDYNICSRTGLHCAPLVHEQLGTFPTGTVRFGLGPFNTEEEILYAIKGIREIATR
ncbi:MAG: aminotransferase class V-fold PLP-dependent enzyme [Candidatus Edwardsbacteria bacterium]